MSLLVFLITVGILIVIHELGHFVVARKEKVRVEKFAVGFGPAIFKMKTKITDILICLFPLGGYVKLAGDNRSEYTGASDEFLSKPPSSRMRIVFAGPLFNYIFAFIIFWIIGMMGFTVLEPTIGEVLDGFPAKTYGVKENDRIIRVNGINVDNWFSMTEIIYRSKEKVTLEVQRDSEILKLEIPVVSKNIKDLTGQERKVSLIGIKPKTTAIRIKRYNPLVAFINAIKTTIIMTFLILKGVFLIITGILPFKDAIAGPLGIYYITSEMAKLGIVAILDNIAKLSLSLAVINLFPLPVLDGGHILIVAIEKIRKKQLSQKAETILTNIGLAIIGILFVVVFYNDILRFGSKIFK